MFSKEFVRYLMNYTPAGLDEVKKQLCTTKEIHFNKPQYGKFAKEYITINKK